MQNDGIPLYKKIEQDLRFKIESSEWAVGEKIPSELELADSYKVSRITIRKALENLTSLGYLVRKRPNGTFVNDISGINNKESYTVITSFTQEMQELGKKPSTVWAEVNTIPANEDMARRLEVNVGTKILSLKRVRRADNEIVTYSETFIPYNRNYSLDSKDYMGSLYEYLGKFNIKVNEQTEYVEAIEPNAELLDKLGLKKREPILKRVRQISQYRNNYIEYSVNYYVGSRYRYYVKY